MSSLSRDHIISTGSTEFFDHTKFIRLISVFSFGDQPVYSLWRNSVKLNLFLFFYIHIISDFFYICLRKSVINSFLE